MPFGLRGLVPAFPCGGATFFPTFDVSDRTPLGLVPVAGLLSETSSFGMVQNEVSSGSWFEKT